MFINARPQFAANGLEAYVPLPVHRKPVEMSNGSVNAFGVSGPLATPPTDDWDPSCHAFRDDENFSVS